MWGISQSEGEMKMNKIMKVKRLHKDAVIPKYAKGGDSGVDLVAVEDTIIEPGETALIKTGLAFEIPWGYEIQVRPRSGITLKTKLRVQLGTIDSNFRGNVGVIVDNVFPPIYEKNGDIAMTDVVVSVNGLNDDETFADTHCFPSGTHYIPKGTRIAQAILAPVAYTRFEETDKLPGSERGINGFGSTGIN